MTEAVSVTDVASLEVPIILLASACGAVVGSFIICPFESVRIRSVSQKDFAPTIIQVAARMVTEEGVPSLFAAIPLFLLKEVPFASKSSAVIGFICGSHVGLIFSCSSCYCSGKIHRV